MAISAEILKHIREEALKYIAAGIFLFVGWLGWYFKDAAIDKLRLAGINFIRQSLVDIAHTSQLGAKTPADLSLALADLQEAFDGQVRRVNSSFVGYLQTDSFKIQQVQGKNGTDLKKENKRFSVSSLDQSVDTLKSFNIFAGRSSHVYLEFEIKNLDHANQTVQLSFFNQVVCPKHDWINGFNVLEFEVIDIQSHQWTFIGECAEPKQQSTEMPRIQSALGHRSQIIPLQFKLISKDENDALTSLHDALESKRDAPRPDDSIIGVSYIVVVSPLVEDTFYRLPKSANVEASRGN